jgi:hypothetical protein
MQQGTVELAKHATLASYILALNKDETHKNILKSNLTMHEKR